MTAYRREQTGLPRTSVAVSMTPRRSPSAASLHRSEHWAEQAASQQANQKLSAASLHRSEHWAGVHGEDIPYTTGNQPPDEDDNETEYDPQFYQMRTGSSAIRWQARGVSIPTTGRAHAVVIHRRASVPARATAAAHRRTPIVQAVPSNEEDEEDEEQVRRVSSPHRRRRKAHWLLFVGLGMLAMLLLWVGLSHLIQWWQMQQNDWTYGRPRTFQMDAVVGHHDSAANPTHFIVVNLTGHIDIIELPGGDPSRARLYTGPVLLGPGQDLVPVTLSVADVNSDGKPDLILHLQGEEVVYLNDGTGFRPLAPGQQVHLP